MRINHWESAAFRVVRKIPSPKVAGRMSDWLDFLGHKLARRGRLIYRLVALKEEVVGWIRHRTKGGRPSPEVPPKSHSAIVQRTRSTTTATTLPFDTLIHPTIWPPPAIIRPRVLGSNPAPLFRASQESSEKTSRIALQKNPSIYIKMNHYFPWSSHHVRTA